MSREIKFRVWDPVSNEMLGFYKGCFTLADIANGCMPDGFFEDSGNGGQCLRDDLVWLQYTGLKDKNGKEIYEGNIVKLRGDGMYSRSDGIGTWEVVFNEGAFYGAANNGVSTIAARAFPRIEVIGNIYENPELLNK